MSELLRKFDAAQVLAECPVVEERVPVKAKHWNRYKLESWACFIAIDAKGIASQFEKEPELYEGKYWISLNGRTKAVDLSMRFDTKNWQNSVQPV